MLKRLFLLAGLLAPLAVSAQTATAKYFGYFGGDYASTSAANPGGPGFTEMKDHVNLFSILEWSGDTSPAGKADSQARFLGKLAEAKAAHTHAIVPAHPFVFQAERSSDGRITCWHYDATAAASWAAFSRAMVEQGYLIPGDPARSTVVAVYVVDEPNGGVCLDDSNGAANPTFVNAVNAIRQDPNTGSLPIASILSTDFNAFSQGMQLLDWVGYDHYGDSDKTWQKKMADLKQRTPGKKYIVVPGAMQGCQDVTRESTSRYFSAIENDPDVTWIAPFAWFSGLGNNPNCRGVRDIPDLRAQYTAEGLKIRALQCSRSEADKNFCRGSSNISAALQLILN